MEKQSDVIVIGAGPAGLSAALMLGRARRRVLVVDAGEPRNRFAAHMHGVLGNEGTPPAELLERARAEVAAYGVELLPGSAVRADPTEHGVDVVLTDGVRLEARALVVATGLRDDLPAVPGLAERWGSSVLHCPYCHGWEVRGRRLGVLTTSPLGLHQAQLVRQWSDDVTVFTSGLGKVEPAVARRLAARGVRMIASPVVEIVGPGTEIEAVRTEDGTLIEIDALFTGGTPGPHEEFLAHLGLDRADTPVGSFLAVDQTGRTSSPRIWAVGNVTNPAATVPMSMGAGATVGGAVNMALVTEDFDRAEAKAPADDLTPAEWWERRYAQTERSWSGRVNRVLADVASELTAGTALDLGCGEGADVVWLAERGWRATGVDISPTAVSRGRAAAERAGLTDEQARFVVADLAALEGGERYDLVTTSFLHSPVPLPRDEILRAAADRVAPGGHLLVTAHAAAPDWADMPKEHHPHFPTPAEDLAALELEPEGWEVLVAEVRRREATGPDGRKGTLEDSVVLARRRA